MLAAQEIAGSFAVKDRNYTLLELEDMLLERSDEVIRKFQF